MNIRPYDPADKPAIVALSLRAWAPVFDSIEDSLEPAVYRAFYPDWRACQRQAVESACDDEQFHVWVAQLAAGVVAGFVAVKAHDETLGEIHMIAVDPDHQRQGLAAALTAQALDWMKGAGLAVAMVETGGDPGHAPARESYVKSGFRLFPVARYFKKL